MRFLITPPVGERARAPFLLLVALTACGTMGMHVIIPALPATARALNMSISTQQLTITLYLVGLAVGQLFYGPVSDRFGRRPVLLAGLTLFTAASVVTACAPNAGVLIGSRILQSIGGCAGLVLGRAAVRDSATPDKAAGQLALLTLVMSVVPALAPAVGGYLTAYIDWRASYVLLAVMGGLTLLVTLLILPETNRERIGGSSPGSLLTGYAILGRSRAFLGYAAGGACSTTSFYAFMSASPFIYENLLHRPTQEVGLYYIFLMGGVGAGSFLANRLSRIVGLREGLRIANFVTIAGAVLFVLFDVFDVLSGPTVTGAVTLFMVGAGMASPFALAGSVSVNPRTIGAASGLYGFFQMGYGMLCTVAVEVWHPGAVYPVAAIMLVSVLAGQVMITLGTRPA
jgi:DHA1 family bicyclomycin/chloramphenicol resistance-like MFS transporter